MHVHLNISYKWWGQITVVVGWRRGKMTPGAQVQVRKWASRWWVGGGRKSKSCCGSRSINGRNPPEPLVACSFYISTASATALIYLYIFHIYIYIYIALHLGPSLGTQFYPHLSHPPHQSGHTSHISSPLIIQEQQKKIYKNNKKKIYKNNNNKKYTRTTTTKNIQEQQQQQKYTRTTTKSF